MICKKNFLYLKISRAKQTFANLPIFGCINEGLIRIYTIYQQLKHRNQQNRTDKIEIWKITKQDLTQ